MDEERAAAREALLAVELVEESLRTSGAHDDFGSDSDESWADKDGLVATPSPFRARDAAADALGADGAPARRCSARARARIEKVGRAARARA